MKKMKNVGISIGTSKSCMGLEEVGEVNIIPNSLGEEIELSVVSIINDQVIAGENVYLNKNIKVNNIIKEIMRLVSLSFINDDNYFEEYKKYLSFNIEKRDDISLIIKIDGKIYSVEEILSFLIKQIIENGKNNNIFAKKFIFTLPACFGIRERVLIKKAAKLADIEESKMEIISETSAASIAYELFINQEKLEAKYEYNIFKLNYNYITDGNLTSGPVLNKKILKNILVFDLGAGSFNLSILSIEEDEGKKLNFNVRANLGNPFFGGLDFDNRLVSYCINEFCKLNKIEENEIYNNKNAIRRLKLQCEIAKIILDSEESVIIELKDFFNNFNLCINLTRDNFNSMFLDYYNEINNKIRKILKVANMNIDSIKEVLIIGGNSKIPKIIEILKDLFGQNKIIDYIDNNKIIITGAALYANEMQKKNKKFNLNEVTFSSFGINIINSDINSYLKYGDKMMKLIRKNSFFPRSPIFFNNDHKKLISNFSFRCKISNDNKICFNIYEGENKFVKFNKKLVDITMNFNESMKNKIIKIYIKFELDKNYILKITVNIPEKNINNTIIMGTVDNNKLDKSKLNSKILEINSEFKKNKQELREYSDSYAKFKDDERNNALINCCKCCEEVLKLYEKNYISDIKIVKIYQFTEELFSYYLERLKIKNKSINDYNKIIFYIKERMKNLMNIEGYNDILKSKFKELSSMNRSLYYSIIINYIEIKVSKLITILKDYKEPQLYCFNIHFEKSNKAIECLLNEMKIYEIKDELYKKVEFLKKIIIGIKNLIFVPNNSKDTLSKLNDIKKEINNLVKSNKKYNSLMELLKFINEIEDTNINNYK